MSEPLLHVVQIPGATPALTALPSGCAFRTRCTHASSACVTRPAQTVVGPRTWRCHHPLHIGAVAKVPAGVAGVAK